MQTETSGIRYWIFLKFAVPLLLVLLTLRLAPGEWRGMAKTLLLLGPLWAYAAALWCPGPLSWCIILVENGATAVIFFTLFIWLNGDMHGLWAISLGLPRDAEVWLAIVAALAGAGQFATIKYFRRRHHHFLPAPSSAAGHWWLLAAGVQLLPLLPSLLWSTGQ